MNEILAQKEDNRLRTMREKKIEMWPEDKEDPYAMNIAYMHFHTMLQNDLHNLYNCDENLEHELFELTQYITKCQKVI